MEGVIVMGGGPSREPKVWYQMLVSDFLAKPGRRTLAFGTIPLGRVMDLFS